MGEGIVRRRKGSISTWFRFWVPRQCSLILCDFKRFINRSRGENQTFCYVTSIIIDYNYKKMEVIPLKTTINQVKQYEGKTVTIGAWLENKRSSGKIAFLQLSDGTGNMQGGVGKNYVREERFESSKTFRQE